MTVKFIIFVLKLANEKYKFCQIWIEVLCYAIITQQFFAIIYLFKLLTKLRVIDWRAEVLPFFYVILLFLNPFPEKEYQFIHMLIISSSMNLFCLIYVIITPSIPLFDPTVTKFELSVFENQLLC